MNHSPFQRSCRTVSVSARLFYLFPEVFLFKTFQFSPQEGTIIIKVAELFTVLSYVKLTVLRKFIFQKPSVLIKKILGLVFRIDVFSGNHPAALSDIVAVSIIAEPLFLQWRIRCEIKIPGITLLNPISRKITVGVSFFCKKSPCQKAKT